MTAVQLQPSTIPTMTPCHLREALEFAWQAGYQCQPASPPSVLSDLGQVAWRACYRLGQGRAVREVARMVGDEDGDDGVLMEEEANP